ASHITIWFLTDGEETRYQGSNGEVDRIPTNKTDPLFGHFNVPGASGLTPYQDKIAKYIGDISTGKKLEDAKCTLDFHICHFGQAHPLFLRAMRERTGGHFHAVADIEKLHKEMTAQATGTNAQLTIVGTQTHK